MVFFLECILRLKLPYCTLFRVIIEKMAGWYAFFEFEDEVRKEISSESIS